MSKTMSKIVLLSFVFITVPFSFVFAGDEEKDILKALERVSSVSNAPGAEFREALSDCQAELKMAKITGSDYPKFMKVAEETFLLFKGVKELVAEHGSINSSLRLSLAKNPHISKLDKLNMELNALQQQKTIIDEMVAKQKAGQQRLEDLYRVYKEEVLKR